MSGPIYDDFLNSFQEYAAQRVEEIKRDIKYCHPRWPGEKTYLEKEIGTLEALGPKYFNDMWYVLNCDKACGHDVIDPE